MTEQLTDAERARLDRELRERARVLQEEAERVAAKLKADMEDAMKALLGG